MDSGNNIISISKDILTLLEEKRRIDGELAKHEVLLMANLKLITMEPPKTVDEQNSPESPISGNSDGLNNYETPLQIPLEREDVKNNSEDNINQEVNLKTSELFWGFFLLITRVAGSVRKIGSGIEFWPEKDLVGPAQKMRMKI